MLKSHAVRAVIATAAVTAFLLPNLASAETTTTEARVKWTVKAVKRSDVSLNVFSDSNTNLDFSWNPSSKQFVAQNAALTIQAAGVSNATGYGIQAQLIQNKLLNHVSGSKSSMTVGMSLGGIEVGDTPVDILRGTGSGTPTTAAQGLQNMVLAKAGPHKGPEGKGTYHEATGVGVKFNVIGGTAEDGTAIAANALDTLPDGTYSGDVELRLVSSWDVPAAEK